MFVIGITGGIGTGKSAVAKIFADKGVRVLDADEISREVTDVGGAAIEEIREWLGDKAIDSRGALNRKFVSSLVFSEKTKLDRLSAIVHRYVLSEIAESLRQEAEKLTKIVVLDVPIPVKNGFLDVCDQVWVVESDVSLRLNRLIERGMEEEDVLRRMSLQMTPEEYAELADVLIDNNADLDALRIQVEKHIKEQLHERGIRI
ncbi:MAG TPA: dephospho-CoA kinase [Clostridiaceae bacterium]|jgi:dephospho-CoA kinase|nr:dephospho-CoA kinase [Clostridiaceae bacterium]